MRCEACGAEERYIVRGVCKQCGHVIGTLLNRLGFEMGML